MRINLKCVCVKDLKGSEHKFKFSKYLDFIDFNLSSLHKAEKQNEESSKPLKLLYQNPFLFFNIKIQT